jgi:hypothetical protein
MTIILVGAGAVLFVALLWLGLRLFDGSREPRHAATGWTPGELARLREPEVHHDEYAPAGFLAAPALAPANRDLWPERRTSPPPWPPEVARPHGQDGDQPPAQVPVAPWRGRRADHQEADGDLGGSHAPAAAASPLRVESPGPAQLQPPLQGDGVDSAAVTAGPGDLAAAAAAIKALTLDDYEAALPGYADPVGAYTGLMAAS